MSGSEPTVYIRIATEGDEKVKRTLESLGVEAERAGKRVQSAFSAASPELQKLAGASDTTVRAFGGLSRGALGVSAGFAAMGAAAVASVTAIAKAGDQANATLARLATASGGAAQAEAVYARLFALSQQTGVAVAESAGAFARFSIAAKEIGGTNDQVLRLVAGIQKAGVVSGAAMHETSAATMQLGQALASGRLQGDELRSLLENMPILAQALARELGVGIGELREMGAAGQLTADRVFPALLRASERMNEEFDKMPVTMERAGSILTAATADFGARLDKITGLSRTFASFMMQGAAALNSMGAAVDPSASDRTATATRRYMALAYPNLGRADEPAPDYSTPGARRNATPIPGRDPFDTTRGRLLASPGPRDASQDRARALEEARKDLEDAIAAEQALLREDREWRRAEDAEASAARLAAKQKEYKALADEIEKGNKTVATIEKKYRAEREKLDQLEANTAGQNVRDAKWFAEQRAALAKREQEEIKALGEAHKKVAKEAKDADAHVREFYKEQEKAAEKASKAAEKAADDMKRYQSRSYDELVSIGERAFDRLGDALVDAFTQGNGAAVNFGNVARAIAASVVTDFAKLAVINPLLNSVFTSSSGARPTLSAAFGGGGTGGLGDLLGLTSLLPKDGILSSLGIGSVGSFLTTPISSTGGFSGFAAGASMPAAITPMSLFGGVGAGFGVGTMLNGLVGGNSTGGMIGSGAGAALGAAATLIPGVGAIIGPLLAGILGGGAGGLLGGLFGPGESVRGYGYRLEAADDGLLRMGASFYNPEGEAAFTQATAGIDAFNAWAGANGIRVGGASSVGGNRNGPDLSNATAGTFADGLAQLYFHAVDAELEAALSSRGNQFASVEAMQQFVQGFGQAQQIIEALTAEPIPAFTAQMQAVNDNFEAAAAQAREYGLATDSLTAAQARAVAELENARAETLRQADANLEARLLAARGDAQGAELARQAEAARLELESFGNALEALGLAAEDRTARLIRLEEVQSAERAAIITRFGQQTVAALDTAFAGSAVLRDLAYGSGSALAPEQQFFAAISDLNAAGRNLASGGSLADYEAVARQVLPVAKDFLGTSTRYGALASDIAQTIAGAGGDPANLAGAIQSQTRNLSLQGEAAIAIAGASHAQLESMNEQIGALARSIETLAAMVQAQMTRAA